MIRILLMSFVSHGQNNPDNSLPVTAGRQAAFNNQNQAVKLKWYSGIAVNAP